MGAVSQDQVSVLYGAGHDSRERVRLNCEWRVERCDFANNIALGKIIASTTLWARRTESFLRARGDAEEDGGVRLDADAPEPPSFLQLALQVGDDPLLH
jgi:hypothetical protein